MRSGFKAVLVQAATGTGKTVVAADMLKTAAERGFPSWFINHRRELIKNSLATFANVGVDAGVISSGFPRNDRALVQICSIQTLLRCFESLPQPRFVIWDECHHLDAGSWAKIYHHLPDAFHVGFSATPIRLDGSSLAKYFQAMVRSPDVVWLQRRGILSKYRHLAPSDLDLSGVRARMGDYVRADLVAAIERHKLTENCVKAYQRFADGRRAVIFAPSIENSERAVELFRRAGITAEHVDGNSATEHRDAAIARFERGETLVLSNVDLFGEGFNVPQIEAVIMLRATLSVGLFLQMIGRCLRPSPGKADAVVIDMVGNWRRHGLASENRRWTLDPAPRRKPAPRTDLWVCESCKVVNPERAYCEACGVPPKPSAKRKSDVDLWLQLTSTPGLADELRRKSYAEVSAWADTPEKIRLVAMVRNFARGWAWHRIRELTVASGGLT